MSNEKWKAENTVRYHFRLSKNTGIPDALKTACGTTGETELEYIRRVVIESLKRDGFMPENKDKR